MVRRMKPSEAQRLAKQKGVRKHRNGIRYKMRIRKGDTVQVIAGRSKGHVGEVLEALPKYNMVIVEGANTKTRHVKPQREGESGSIQEKEAPIHVSNVMAYSKKQEVVSRIEVQLTEDGRKVRVLKKTGEILED